MAAIHEIQLESSAGEVTQKYWREMFAAGFWSWYYANADKTIVEINFFVFKKKVKVRQLRNLFVILFGESRVDKVHPSI